MTDRYHSLDDMPPSLPVFPLTGVLLLPRGALPLNVFEPRYLALVDAALSGNRLIGLIQPTENEEETLKPEARPASAAPGASSPSAKPRTTAISSRSRACAASACDAELAIRRRLSPVESDFAPFAGDLVERRRFRFPARKAARGAQGLSVTAAT